MKKMVKRVQEIFTSGAINEIEEMISCATLSPQAVIEIVSNDKISLDLHSCTTTIYCGRRRNYVHWQS